MSRRRCRLGQPHRRITAGRLRGSGCRSAARRRRGEKLLALWFAARCFKLGVPSCAAAAVSRLPRAVEAGTRRDPLRGCEKGFSAPGPCGPPPATRVSPARYADHASRRGARVILQTRTQPDLPAACRDGPSSLDARALPILLMKPHQTVLPAPCRRRGSRKNELGSVGCYREPAGHLWIFVGIDDISRIQR